MEILSLYFVQSSKFCDTGQPKLISTESGAFSDGNPHKHIVCCSRCGVGAGGRTDSSELAAAQGKVGAGLRRTRLSADTQRQKHIRRLRHATLRFEGNVVLTVTLDVKPELQIANNASVHENNWRTMPRLKGSFRLAEKFVWLDFEKATSGVLSVQCVNHSSAQFVQKALCVFATWLRSLQLHQTMRLPAAAPRTERVVVACSTKE